VWGRVLYGRAKPSSELENHYTRLSHSSSRDSRKRNGNTPSRMNGATSGAKSVSGRSLLRFVVSVFFSLSPSASFSLLHCSMLDMSLVCNKIMASGSNSPWSEEGCKKKTAQCSEANSCSQKKLAIEFNFTRRIKSIRISSGIKSWTKTSGYFLHQAHASEFHYQSDAVQMF
jgi:hypothetical protein